MSRNSSKSVDVGLVGEPIDSGTAADLGNEHVTVGLVGLPLDSRTAIDLEHEQDEHSLYISRAVESHRRQVQALRAEVNLLSAALEAARTAKNVTLVPSHALPSPPPPSPPPTPPPSPPPAGNRDLFPEENLQGARSGELTTAQVKEGTHVPIEPKSPADLTKHSQMHEAKPYAEAHAGMQSSGTNSSLEVYNEINKDARDSSIEQQKRTATGLRVAEESSRCSRVNLEKSVMQHNMVSDKWMERWESAIAALIVANAIFLGWHLEARATYQPLSKTMLRIVTLSFTAVFSVDLLWRLARKRKQFFVGPDRYLNLLDMVVVVSMCFESMGSQVSQISILRTFRILRLLRVLRVVRAFKFFREFRLMVYSAIGACRAMFWSTISGLLLLYIASLGLTDACLSHCLASNHDEFVCKYFGSVGSSMMSLYEAVLGGVLWGELVEALSHVDPVAAGIFVIFVSTCLLLILNISAAMIFDVVQRVSHRERETIIEDEIMHKEQYIRDMRQLFLEIDANNSGAISVDELEIACGDQRMEALLSAMKIDVTDMQRLFLLLDVDNTNAVDIEEFLLGCQRLKGEAKTIDVVTIQHEVNVLLHYVLEIRQHMALNSSSPAEVKTQVQDEDASLADFDDMRSMPSMTSSRSLKSKEHGKGGKTFRIKKPEDRAMLLCELQDVREVIESRCELDGWTNPRTGELLEPHKIDLYQFSHHYICPQTAGGAITLCGLKPAKYNVGDFVAQVDRSRECAAGHVVESSEDGNVRVEVWRGRFEAAGVGRNRQVRINDVESGVPEEVVAVNAISYKELVSRAPQKPRWYCSHWWGERIFDFLACCGEHASRRRMSPEVASYWVCGYANRQYELAESLSANIKATSFWKAINAAEGVLLMLDDKGTPFERIWCDFEIYEALVSDSRKMLDIITVTQHDDGRKITPHMISDGPLPKETARDKTKRESGFPLVLLVKGVQTKLEEGKASVEKDKTTIIRYLTKDSSDDEAVQRANCALHAFFAKAAWPQALRNKKVRDFDESQPGEVRLPMIMAQDTESTSCIMSLEHMMEVTDLEVRSLAEGLPPQLRELSLSFEGCPNITAVGLQSLAQSLPRGLQSLKLDFLGCRQLRDDGLEELAEALPSTVQTLCLHFDKCERVSIRSIQALAENIPRGATFNGTFKGTGVDRNFPSLSDMKRYANANRR